MTIQELLKKYESMLEYCQKKALSSFVDLESIVADLRELVSHA